MNNIGFGIFCFGEEYYYKITSDKVKQILNGGYHCYVLTDNPEYFKDLLTSLYLHVISYDRTQKSYHDKMILPKHILKNHDISILIDADTEISDYTFLDDLKTYNFKEGISYIDTLVNHPIKKEYVDEMDLTQHEWIHYKNYIDIMYPSYNELEMLWEYFIVINKNGFNQEHFYNIYEKLQVAKEYCGIINGGKIIASGEGVSTTIASKLSSTNIEKDNDLTILLKNKMRGVTKIQLLGK